jgi:hypothetical protein
MRVSYSVVPALEEDAIGPCLRMSWCQWLGYVLVVYFSNEKSKEDDRACYRVYCIASTVGRLVADWTSEQSTGRVMAHGRSDDIDLLDKKKEERL